MQKKTLASALAAVSALALFAGCSSPAPAPATSSSGGSKAPVSIAALNVAFVPSVDPAKITTTTAPLAGMLIQQLGTMGYNVGKVNITVGTTYEAVGEGLDAGTIDVGFIPGGTYVTYDSGCDVILTATRNGLSIDSPDPTVWNKQKPTTAATAPATFYRALIIAGPSAKGQALAAKVNGGQALTWDDVNSANFAIMSTTSSAGYIYPTLWMENQFKHSVSDLAHAAVSDSYGTSFARLASGQVDVVLAYADARMDYAKAWTTTYGRTADIWAETNLIGVTDKIYNDTVSASKNSATLKNNPGLSDAIAQAMINIGNTTDGKAVIAIYQHTGYQLAKSSDYDNERAAQALIKQLKG